MSGEKTDLPLVMVVVILVVLVAVKYVGNRETDSGHPSTESSAAISIPPS